MNKHEERLAFLDMPKGKYILAWSALLEALNLRESHDLDVLVKKDLRDILTTKYPENIEKFSVYSKNHRILLAQEKIEIVKQRPYLKEYNGFIFSHPFYINDMPYVHPHFLIRRKRAMWRIEKDPEDIAAMINRRNSYNPSYALTNESSLFISHNDLILHNNADDTIYSIGEQEIRYDLNNDEIKD